MFDGTSKKEPWTILPLAFESIAIPIDLDCASFEVVLDNVHFHGVFQLLKAIESRV